MNNDNFAQWTQELLEEERKNGRATNILQICMEHFEAWEYELIPLLRKNGKPGYRSIVEMLHKNGNLNANEAMIQKYFSRIRKRKGITGRKSLVDSSLTQTRTVEVVPTPVVVSPVAAPKTAPMPEVQPPSHRVQGARPIPPRQADEIAYPHVYAKTSLTTPVEFENLRDEEDRWKKESIEGWIAPWTGVDEHMWLIFLEKIVSYNRYNNPRWTVHGHCAGFRKELSTDQLRNVYDLLKRKVVAQRKI